MTKPKYSDGITEAQVGDVVRCVQEGLHCIEVGEQVTVRFARPPYIYIKGIDQYEYPPGFFELIQRQQEEMMNGKYASGEEPMTGDVVAGIAGLKMTAVKISSLSGDVLCDNGLWFTPRNLTLISRKEQPMSEPQPEPLVKWPEGEPVMFASLDEGEFFVFSQTPQSPCVRLSGDCYRDLVGGANGHCINRPVRRLKMIRPPQFEVI